VWFKWYYNSQMSRVSMFIIDAWMVSKEEDTNPNTCETKPNKVHVTRAPSGAPSFHNVFRVVHLYMHACIFNKKLILWCNRYILCTIWVNIMSEYDFYAEKYNYNKIILCRYCQPHITLLWIWIMLWMRVFQMMNQLPDVPSEHICSRDSLQEAIWGS